jgi:YesN/AraC family two-component response regulator
MILTGYPAFQTALEAIRQQVDDYIVKPANIPALVSTIESKLTTPARQRQLPPTKRVATLLQEHRDRVEDLWLGSVETDVTLSRVPSTREQRLAYVRALLEKVIRAAPPYSTEKTAEHNGAAAGHGSNDYFEGHTPSTILAEFCLLRRAVAQIVQENLLAVNLSYLVPDLARVNETLDEQAQAALKRVSEQIDASRRTYQVE